MIILQVPFIGTMKVEGGCSMTAGQREKNMLHEYKWSPDEENEEKEWVFEACPLHM